jgi:hypothetical protein
MRAARARDIGGAPAAAWRDGVNRGRDYTRRRSASKRRARQTGGWRFRPPRTAASRDRLGVRLPQRARDRPRCRSWSGAGPTARSAFGGDGGCGILAIHAGGRRWLQDAARDRVSGPPVLAGRGGGLQFSSRRRLLGPGPAAGDSCELGRRAALRRVAVAQDRARLSSSERSGVGTCGACGVWFRTGGAVRRRPGELPRLRQPPRGRRGQRHGGAIAAMVPCPAGWAGRRGGGVRPRLPVEIRPCGCGFGGSTPAPAVRMSPGGVRAVA